MSTVHISYSTQSTHYPIMQNSKMPQDGSTALHALTSDWQSQGRAGTHAEGKNPGQFYSEGAPVRFGGDTYSFDIGNSYAFSATGELNYYLGFGPGAGRGTPHTLHGKVESLELGHMLDKGTGKVVDPFLSLNFETPISGSLAQGHGGDVHKVIWGLMNANANSLVDMLEDVYDVDVEASLIDLGTPLVGIAGVDDGLLAA